MDAVRSVEYILDEGTSDSNSQTEVQGFADSNYRGKYEGYETYRGDRTGFTIEGKLEGTSSTSSFEVQSSYSMTQNRLANRLANLFGPYLPDPEIVLNEDAINHQANSQGKRGKYYTAAITVIGVWVALEVAITGFVLWSVLLGGPIALVIAVIGWFLGFGTESEAVEIARESVLNKKRAKLVEAFNSELAGLYAWLQTQSYCARCNVISDEDDFYELRDLSHSRPKEPKLPLR